MQKEYYRSSIYIIAFKKDLQTFVIYKIYPFLFPPKYEYVCGSNMKTFSKKHAFVLTFNHKSQFIENNFQRETTFDLEQNKKRMKISLSNKNTNKRLQKCIFFLRIFNWWNEYVREDREM